MVKLLLKLWAEQKRRNFKWGRFLGQAYFFFLFLVLSFAVTMVFSESIKSTEGIERIVGFIAISIIVPDFIYKLLIKHDETVMDHYLKSRPIPEKAWNKFLLITNLVNFWNWALPICLLPFCIIFLPWWAILPSMLLFLAVSMVGGVAITAFRRARSFSDKWPVLVAMLIWLLIATAYAVVGMMTPWWFYMVGFLMLCVGAIAVFYDYLCDLRRYEESRASARRLFFSGSFSLFSMEYVSVLRSKRLRIGMILLPLVFVFNSYTQSFNGTGVMFDMMFCMAVLSPSLMLGQWVFGIEGNYMDGLWTKPVSILHILQNKFWFYALLDLFPLLLLLPMIWTKDVSPWLFVATWLFAVGIFNLSLMPTCLISSRIELFQSAFFNYQGASMAINLYGLLCFIPLIAYCLILWLLPPTTAYIVITLLGLVGIAIHPFIIKWLARRYEQHRYENFERYRQ